MNVVIYARFSSHSQTEQSIEGQLKVCYEYAAQHSYTVIGEYIDRAISGKTDERPQFQQMMCTSLTVLPGIGMIALSTKSAYKRTVCVFSAPKRISLMIPAVY